MSRRDRPIRMYVGTLTNSNARNSRIRLCRLNVGVSPMMAPKDMPRLSCQGLAFEFSA